jgi:hypothetical protein
VVDDVRGAVVEGHGGPVRHSAGSRGARRGPCAAEEVEKRPAQQMEEEMEAAAQQV